MYRRWGKRMLDLVVVVPAIIALAPLIAIVALAIRVVLGPGVLFSQERAGYRGQAIRIYKFRTMTAERDSQGELLPDEQRLTRFGKFLRKCSFDELPQLWNVLRGDISLVGPRPLLIRYLPRYTPTQNRRHEVQPGITGWAQLNGRNAISWGEKFKLDVWYVDHLSFALDLKILLRTIGYVFRGGDVNSAVHATMPEFTGEPDAADETGTDPSLPDRQQLQANPELQRIR